MKHLTVYYNGKERGMESYLHALFKAFYGMVSVRVISGAQDPAGSREPELKGGEEKTAADETGGRSNRSRQRKEREQLEDPDRRIFSVRLLGEPEEDPAAEFFSFDAKAAADEELLITEDADGLKDKALFYKRQVLRATEEIGMAEAVKSFVYRCLAEYTKKSLPWGSLMGVRPTKLARKRMEEILQVRGGKTAQTLFTEDERKSINDFYRERYFVSEQKAQLATQIAERELSLIRRLHPEKGFSLYVGVPFCPTRCLYCSFVSNAVGSCRNLVEPCLNATIREIEESAKIMKGRVLDTVYIGGGTPTALEAEQLERLMGAISDSFDLSGILEYTVEAGRADSITRDKLRVIREGGANRICLNPQSMNEETLRLIGRAATAQQVKEAFYLAREEGFSHINMDMILGLPGEDTRMVENTLEEVKRLDPDSMTVHSLAVKRGSDLNRIMIEKGIDPHWDTTEAMERAFAAAEQMQLLPYYLYRQKNMTGNLENVGFAKEGKSGIYNILIMEEVQSVIACGAGTITKKVDEGSIVRCDDPREISQYIDTIEELIREKAALFEA